MDELDERGLDYVAAAVTNEFGGSFPALIEPPSPGLPPKLQDIQFTDRDVILCRNDLPLEAMALSNIQGGNFDWRVMMELGGQELPWVVVNDDPLREGKQALFVVGTDQKDTFRLGPHGSNALAVGMSRPGDLGVFSLLPDEHIYLNASGGDDIVLALNVKRDTSIYAGLGNDVVFAGRGHDVIFGGAGNDCLFGMSGDDALWGGAGNDCLFGGVGKDQLRGESGNDWLFGGLGDDELDGGDGYDWLFGGPGFDLLQNGERTFA